MDYRAVNPKLSGWRFLSIFFWYWNDQQYSGGSRLAEFQSSDSRHRGIQRPEVLRAKELYIQKYAP